MERVDSTAKAEVEEEVGEEEAWDEGFIFINIYHKYS